MFLGGFSAAASARAPRAHRDPSPRFARCSLQAQEQHRCSPGWAGTYLLAPFSSPINLEVFLYGSQAPTGPSSRASWGQGDRARLWYLSSEGRDAWGLSHHSGLERLGEGCGVSAEEMQGHQKEPPRTNNCASTHRGTPAVTAVGAGILAE